MASKALITVQLNFKGLDGAKQSEQYMKSLRDAIRSVDEQIQSNEKIVEGSVAAYKLQKNALIQIRDAYSTSSTMYAEITQRIVEADLAIKNITQSEEKRQGVVVGSFQYYEQEIQLLEHRIKTRMIDNDLIREAYTEIGRMRAEQKKLVAGTKLTGRGMANMSNRTGAASMAVVDLGRTIGDFNYGIQGVANNLQQLTFTMGETFKSAGSVGGAFKDMAKSLMGPAGLLVLVSTITTIWEAYDKKQKQAAKSTRDLTNELIQQSVIMQQIANNVDIENMEREDQIKLLKTLALQNQEINTILSKREEGQKEISDKQIDAALEVIKLQRELNTLGIDFNKTIEGTDKTYKDLTLTQQGLADAQEVANKAQEDFDKFRFTGQQDRLAQDLAIANAIVRATEEGLKALQDFGEEGRTYYDVQQQLNDLVDDFGQKAKSAGDELAKWSDYVQDLNDALLDARISLIEDLADDAMERGDIGAYQLHMNTLEQLKKDSLDRRKKAEIDAAKETFKDNEDKANEAIGIIEKKYELLYLQLNRDLTDEFTKGVKKLNPTLELTLKTRLAGMPDDTPTGLPEDAGDDLLGRANALRAEGEQYSKEEMRTMMINQAQETISGFVDFLDSEAQREIDIEKRKTNAVNDELKRRLMNENLSAAERKRINVQIAKNEADLVKKENEINRERFKQQKAAGIANAVINTYLGASQVLSDGLIQPSFLKIPLAASMIALGLAQVASIARQEFVPKAVSSRGLRGGGAVGSGGGGFNPTFNVVGASQENQLLEAVQAKLGEPVKAYVVSNEVTTAQSMDRNIVESAGI